MAMRGTTILILLSVVMPLPATVAHAQSGRPIVAPPGSGTGVDRNGIMARRTPQVRTFTIPQRGHYHWGYYSTPGYRFYPGDYYYNDYFCPYCGGAWCNGSCLYGRGPVYLPPVVAGGNSLFGIRAAQEFLGVGGGNQQAAGNTGRGAGPLLPAEPAAPKVSNPTARAQAWKFVEFGDRQFKRGEYRQALDRYDKAARQANDLADIHFRKAFAQVGMGKYAEAAESVKTGLQVKPSWPESGFVLEELYPTAEAKRAIFRQLTLHLDAHPRDAEALYMLAVMQHFDGQEAAAEVKFRSVIELLGQAEHARLFLPADPPAAANPAPPGGAQEGAKPIPPQEPRGPQPPPIPPGPRPAQGFGNLPQVDEP
jgi:hypothetical protein